MSRGLNKFQYLMETILFLHQRLMQTRLQGLSQQCLCMTQNYNVHYVILIDWTVDRNGLGLSRYSERWMKFWNCYFLYSLVKKIEIDQEAHIVKEEIEW